MQGKRASYNVAVIGTGYMARKHSSALMSHDSASLVSICSSARSLERALEFQRLYGFASVTTSYDSVLRDPNIDIVFICTPDNTHTANVCKALESGKHVFCEKPLACAESDFRAIAKHLEASRKTLEVSMNCRFREQYVITKRLITTGEFGGLRFLRGTYIINAVQGVRDREKTWWLDFPEDIFPFLHRGGIHCLDLLRWIGGNVNSVFARAT